MCKECSRAHQKKYKNKYKKYGRKWYLENREKALKRGLEYRKNNKDKIKELSKKYRESNKEEIAESKKRWYMENRERMLEKFKENYRENKERHSKWVKKYYLLNKEDIKKYQREYKVQRRSDDPLYKLNCNMSSAIGAALREAGESKHNRTWEKLVGYTKEELKNHLELKFKDKMDWRNYGKWHIDHIRPISSFDYKNNNDEDFLKCWALDNLQPLWAKDNLSKSNKFGELA